MTRLVSFLLVLAIFMPLLWAQEEGGGADASEYTLRPGMEVRKFGGITMIVPEGTEIYEEDGRIMMEGIDEYTARRFRETDARVKKIEDNQEELKKNQASIMEELKKLGQTMQKLRENLSNIFGDQ